jgi:GDP-4-dehydro-6-deoxy-D-mannose reductase
MKNVLVSGAAGSGGSYLCEYIVSNHPDVKVHALVRWHSTTTRNNLSAIKDKIVIHECDLLDFGSVIRVLREVRPEKIFNLASHANVRVAFDTPLAVLNNNITSTANLLEAIRLECPETVFQHCSTSELYGVPQVYPMTENHPMAPVNPYAVSKLAQEALSYAYFKSWGIKLIISRAFAYLNPKRHDLFATAFALEVARVEAGKKKVLRHGNLRSIRTLMDVRDMMRAYWIMSEKCELGTPYNVAGKDVLSVGDFLEILKSHAKCHIPCEQDPSLLRPVDVDKQIADISKFEAATGFKPQYSLDESVEWLLDECRKVVSNEV